MNAPETATGGLEVLAGRVPQCFGSIWQLAGDVIDPVRHCVGGMTISVSEPKRLEEGLLAESPEYTARHS
jgi:hypothetical protein